MVAKDGDQSRSTGILLALAHWRADWVHLGQPWLGRRATMTACRTLLTFITGMEAVL
jgi:hypothetical protein